MNRKTITVFTASYNDGNHLENSLAMIVGQSRQPDEVMVVDDGSSDNTYEVMMRYADKHVCINAIRHKLNQGLTQIAHDAVQDAKGEYFCGIGADDPLHDGFIETAMGQLEKHPDAGFCCGEYRAEYVDGRSFDVTIDLSRKPTYFSPKEYANLLQSRREVSIATCTTVWKKSHLQDLGGVIPGLRWHYDWFNAVVIAFRYGFCYVPGIYQTVCYDDQSYSFKGQRDWQEQREVLRTLFETLDLPEFEDVKPYFRIPAVISKFGPLLLSVLLEKQEWHDYLSWKLVQYVLDQDVDTRNTQLELKSSSPEELSVSELVDITSELLSGLSAQYNARALYKASIGDEESSGFFEQRSTILARYNTPNDVYMGLAFRYHDYWIDSRAIRVRRWLRFIEELPSNIKLAIYGTGRFGRNMLRMLSNERPDVRVTCFVDRESVPDCDGLEVVSIDQLKVMMAASIDCVLICSTYYDEIFPDLKKSGIQNIACVDAGEVMHYFCKQ